LTAEDKKRKRLSNALVWAQEVEQRPCMGAENAKNEAEMLFEALVLDVDVDNVVVVVVVNVCSGS
jgi:hypothetical protein